MRRNLKQVLLRGLCAAVLCVLVGVSHAPQHVSAAPIDPIQTDSVGIDGIVKGNPPTQGATIAFPSNGQAFSTLPIRVGGSCPSGLLIKLFKNGVFAGSAQCSGGSYSLTIDLFDGKNDLIARDYDALDQAGPDSNTVAVTYSQGGFNTNGPRIGLTSIYAKRGANPNETLSWPIVLSGGISPYAVSVDWGDGKSDLQARTQPGEFTIEHKYASPGIYIILIKATDKNNESAYLQLVGVGNGALSQSQQSATTTTVVVKSNNNLWLSIAAGVFVVIAFWLGGRFKLQQLRREAEKHIQY